MVVLLSICLWYVSIVATCIASHHWHCMLTKLLTHGMILTDQCQLIFYIAKFFSRIDKCTLKTFGNLRQSGRLLHICCVCNTNNCISQSVSSGFKRHIFLYLCMQRLCKLLKLTCRWFNFYSYLSKHYLY